MSLKYRNSNVMRMRNRYHMEVKMLETHTTTKIYLTYKILNFLYMHVSSSEIQVFIIFYILIVSNILINIYLHLMRLK